jgi:hypothetical protein
MNTRKYPRTSAEAFPTGPEYGCAIEKPSNGHRAAYWTIAFGLVYVIAWVVWEAL